MRFLLALPTWTRCSWNGQNFRLLSISSLLLFSVVFPEWCHKRWADIICNMHFSWKCHLNQRPKWGDYAFFGKIVINSRQDFFAAINNSVIFDFESVSVMPNKTRLHSSAASQVVYWHTWPLGLDREWPLLLVIERGCITEMVTENFTQNSLTTKIWLNWMGKHEEIYQFTTIDKIKRKHILSALSYFYSCRTKLFEIYVSLGIYKD